MVVKGHISYFNFSSLTNEIKMTATHYFNLIKKYKTKAIFIFIFNPFLPLAFTHLITLEAGFLFFKFNF